MSNTPPDWLDDAIVNTIEAIDTTVSNAVDLDAGIAAMFAAVRQQDRRTPTPSPVRRSPARGHRVLINYRQADSGVYRALLYLGLVQHLGPDMVFMDSMSLPAGSDFTATLLAHVRRSRVVLALIGPAWLTATDPSGRRLIDNPSDWVRRELAEAFAAGVRVIPVLTDGAVLPTEAELPPEISNLSRCQSRPLRAEDVTSDLDRLRKDLTRSGIGAVPSSGRVRSRELARISAFRDDVIAVLEAAKIGGAQVKQALGLLR